MIHEYFFCLFYISIRNIKIHPFWYCWLLISSCFKAKFVCKENKKYKSKSTLVPRESSLTFTIENWISFFLCISVNIMGNICYVCTIITVIFWIQCSKVRHCFCCQCYFIFKFLFATHKKVRNCRYITSFNVKSK